MDMFSLNSEPAIDDEAEGLEIEENCAMTEFIGQNGVIEGENPLPPAVGMEFESYEDVYYFYNCYAKEQGFGVRVSNSWYRKDKERYRGKLSCSNAGYKRRRGANHPRPETRTGCRAMIKFKLMQNTRWRIIEVELEHNHLISPASVNLYKSHKNVGLGTKRGSDVDGAEQVQKMKLFRTVIVDSESDGNIDVRDRKFRNRIYQSASSAQLILKEGDAQAIQNSFCHLQLMNPEFVYLIDLNERGCLRNVFWCDARARVAYGYFPDVIAIDTSCLKNGYEVPLVAIVGINHHGQPILLGSGLVAGETIETFVWLFRAWITCIHGRPPQAIITDHCKILESAIADVFPRASHCFSLSSIMQKFPEKLGGLDEYEAIRMELSRAVSCSLRVFEFEAAWQDIIQRHGLGNHPWIQSLHEDRKRWVPVYLKEIFLAGMIPLRQSEEMTPFFAKHLHKDTPVTEFLDKYDEALQANYQEERLADLKSKNPTVMLKSKFHFELQLSKLYTFNIFRRFQTEIEGIYSCTSARQISADGAIITYMVKERLEFEENRTEEREYEVLYNNTEGAVVCMCGAFNLKGYLCRHALIILTRNGTEEIPPQYILSRWRKDIERTYILDHCFNGFDVNNPIHRYDNLYRHVLQVVETGKKSEDHYRYAIEALGEILNKVRLVGDQPSCD
ncbi:hypothetical protein Ancab_040433 [Ancistrocladus abbreviatus]